MITLPEIYFFGGEESPDSEGALGAGKRQWIMSTKSNLRESATETILAVAKRR